MTKIQVSIDLPDLIFEKAQTSGLLNPENLSCMIVDHVEQSYRPRIKRERKEWPKDKPLPEGFDPLLIEVVDPYFYGKAKAVGDIVSPIDVEWEAMQ